MGFVASRKLVPAELRMWLTRCADGDVYPGPKVDVLARPTTLELRIWPPGSRWYSQLEDELRGDFARLEEVARHRPTMEILTPTPLAIQPDGTVEELEADATLCPFHGKYCWAYLTWLGEGVLPPEFHELANRRASAINEAIQRIGRELAPEGLPYRPPRDLEDPLSGYQRALAINEVIDSLVESGA